MAPSVVDCWKTPQASTIIAMNARQQRPMVLTPLVLIEIPPLNLPTLRTREHVSMTLRGGTEAPSLGRDTVTENAYCRQQPMPCFVSHVLPQEVTTAKSQPCGKLWRAGSGNIDLPCCCQRPNVVPETLQIPDCWNMNPAKMGGDECALPRCTPVRYSLASTFEDDDAQTQEDSAPRCKPARRARQNPDLRTPHSKAHSGVSKANPKRFSR